MNRKSIGNINNSVVSNANNDSACRIDVQPSQERRPSVFHWGGWAFVAVVALIILSYCTWMCIHYHIRHYAAADIAARTTDFFGLVVGFFALLVTLLVGWQIWQTINTKQELHTAKQDIGHPLQAQLTALSNRVDKIENDLSGIIKSVTRNEAKIGAAESQNLVDKLRTLAREGRERSKFEREKVNSRLYAWLENRIDCGKSDIAIAADYFAQIDIDKNAVAFVGDVEPTLSQLAALLDEIRIVKRLSKGT